MTNAERAKELSDKLLEWGMQGESARIEAIETALDEAEQRGSDRADDANQYDHESYRP